MEWDGLNPGDPKTGMRLVANVESDQQCRQCLDCPGIGQWTRIEEPATRDGLDQRSDPRLRFL